MAISGAVIGQQAPVARHATPEELGAALFADRNLSFSRRQNCVSCHSPELAFTDPRQLGDVRGAVSRGSDGSTLGDRNAPTLTYVAFVPDFRFDANGQPVGGLFHDGRAVDLADQAGRPLIDPLEMAMPNRESVVIRLRENPAYTDAFDRLFGAGTLEDTGKAFVALGSALAAFERGSEFAALDSRYDRSLRGQEVLTAREKTGRDLFFSSRTSCSGCHLRSPDVSWSESFSNDRYYNLGVPPNTGVRNVNGKGAQFVDAGLARNPMTQAGRFAGRYRVPTLRNVAVTGPYMHNGVFQDLRTAILFHDRMNGPSDGLNPETGAPWGKAEVEGNLALSELVGTPLTNDDVDALAAFLATLTDKRYERLLPAP